MYVIANGACREVSRGRRAVSASLHGDELVILTVSTTLIAAYYVLAGRRPTAS